MEDTFEEDMDDPFEQLMARREPRKMSVKDDGPSTSFVRRGSDEGSSPRHSSPRRSSPRHSSPRRSSPSHSSPRRSSPRRGNPLNRSASYLPPRASFASTWRESENAWQVGGGHFFERPRGRGRSLSYGRGARRQPQEPSPFPPRGSGGGQRRSVSPYLLVDCLIEYPNFRSSLLNLMEEKELPPKNVRETTLTYSQVFSLEGEEVVLRPRVGVCATHSGPNGCENRPTCNDLHICPKYLLSWCKDNNCILGHRWQTDHNRRILQQFYIDRLPFRNLRTLIQRLTKAKGPVGQLSICQEYNRGGCNKNSCVALHVCHSFITGLARCSVTGCQLNHNLQTPECSHLLTAHGFSINEAPRDITGALLAAYPFLSQGNKSVGVRKSDSDATNGNITNNGQKATYVTNGSTITRTQDTISSNKMDKAKPKNGKSSKDDISNRDHGSGTSNVQSSRAVKPKTTNQVPKATSIKEDKQTTQWTHHLYGNTEINELCFYSVESVCRYESSCCKRLHSAYHYHWQVSEDGIKWLNLRHTQVKQLEVSYCNPDEISVDLPRLDPADLDTSTKYLLTVMGRDSWKANFQAMIITNSTQSKLLHMRRLCTERIDGHVIDENIYSWYFLDKNKKWVMYGKVDTAGEKNLVSSITSDDIEKHYHQTQASLTFRNARFTYILNFASMTQTNQQTSVSREVCRRPKPHIKIKSADSTTSNSNTGSGSTSDLPSTWEPMQPQERVRLVDLSPTSSEYQAVLSLLKGQIQQANIQKIQRIQNPYLWRAFQNKIREMTTVYGDISKVNVRQIFHGTGYNVVASICAENFDWRLHGTSAGQMHGRGTYFSPNAATSHGYCKADPSGVRYMFVAQVAVGTLTHGNASTVRPPINPATNAPFDSTGDGTNVIVKYDKQEYYPEYVLSIR
ncbi:protein mono-ADP-ribosyltransferase PARP12 [Penaeus vannamei]|uniref:protein mono-ADP-ribosyltransferase PARP12 n=1 Tax=Penaeus vannamei TaxID=6689 RepID=UPI00387F6F6C